MIETCLVLDDLFTTIIFDFYPVLAVRHFSMVSVVVLHNSSWEDGNQYLFSLCRVPKAEQGSTFTTSCLVNKNAVR